MAEELITFIEENAEGVQFLHNDIVVISLNVENYNMHRILIDNGSLVDILYYDDFVKMKIFPDRLGR